MRMSKTPKDAKLICSHIDLSERKQVGSLWSDKKADTALGDALLPGEKWFSVRDGCLNDSWCLCDEDHFYY